MSFVNKLNKIADRFERKIIRLAADKDNMGTESEEKGVHATILFGDNPSTKLSQFKSSVSKAMGTLIPNAAVKYNTNIDVTLFPDISVGSSANSGSILPGVTINSMSADSKKAEPAQQLKLKLDEIYKSVFGKNFAGRAKDLNANNKFPLNANKVSPEISFNFAVGAPEQDNGV